MLAMEEDLITGLMPVEMMPLVNEWTGPCMQW